MKLIIFLGILAGIFTFFWPQKPTETEQTQLVLKKNLERRIKISAALKEPLQTLQFPEYLRLRLPEGSGEETYQVSYTLEGHLQKQAADLLRQYKPDYGVIFMMDALTGRVLTFASFQKDAGGPTNLVTRATYPAASVFKIVTATAAIDKAGVRPSDSIRFNGGNYTLYKKNVMSDRINRWTRTITLRDAFARSINTAFGRLGLENLAPTDLEEYATRFMFNQEIPADFPVDVGVARIPAERSYEFTQAASGFNKTNRMSPVQGAMIAASVINGGRMLMPYMVEALKDGQGHVVYEPETIDNGAIMSPESAMQVREIMEETILSGTSRKSFRPLVRDRKFQEIEMGGKTGHLTGDDPKGRVDWFVGYASDENRKISVAALTVNKQYWTVKSAYLAKMLVKKYFEPTIQQRRISTSR